MDTIKNSKILITGGAGFIGSNLTESLIDQNEIVIVDDLSMGKKENLPHSNNLHFFKHSITDTTFMKSLLLKWNFDYIFLLAAVASVADTIKRPLETHEINQNANLNILETIRLNNLGIKKLVFASSAAVYGNDPELPKKENSVINPLSPYAIDKFATERFVINYGKLYGIPSVCTRFFNVYGPRQNPDSPYSGVLSLIVNALKFNKKFFLFGTGTQTRDFVHVEDVVKALQLLASNSDTELSVYNIATGTETSLNKVIQFLESASGHKLEIENKQTRKGDIQRSVADISKIEALGFEPSVNVKEGLKKYWEYTLDKD